MPTLTSLIDALTQPGAYRHRPERVQFLRTHISVLLFAGDLVYKIKKPVNPGFLDYSTLEKRKRFCEEEVRLNRRLAPETYLGVATIVRDDADAVRVIPAGESVPEDTAIVEYAVEMHRLPERFMLTDRLDRGEIDNVQLDTLAELLVRFHENCATGDGVDEHATPEAIRQQVDENFAELERDVSVGETLDTGAVLTRDLHQHLRDWCKQFLDEHGSLMAHRVEAGRIREGHGDLHAGNICMMPEKIVIYDCIEFTPRFRCRDVACELAFLAMDLDKRGYRGFARYLIRSYAALAKDEGLATLVDFYKLHLAMVRAKVTAMKAREKDVAEEERQRATVAARSYAHLAACYTFPPVVIVMTGLPGSGKSSAARAISEPFEAAVFRSDAIRKELAGLEANEHVAEEDKSVVYSSQFTKRTYEAMFRRAAEALNQGRTVVLDAMFATAEQRAQAVELATSRSAPFLVMHTYADDETIRRRMLARAADEREISDADWQVYERARSGYQPPDEIDSARRISFGPGVEDTEMVSGVLSRLTHRQWTGQMNGARG